jgi:hypothetical protein
MFKNFRDKVGVSGIVVLIVGVALLIFTFISAYGFLTQSLSIVASADLVQTFGEALAPLIEASIHIMYLGVMGWVGSLLTIRGVTIIAHIPQLPEQLPTGLQKPAAQAQPQPQQKQQPQKEKPKAEQPQPPQQQPQQPQPQPQKEPKQPEPEIIVIPPEQLPATQPPAQQKQNGQQPANS